MSIIRNEMFGDIQFGVEDSRDEICTIKDVTAILPEGTFSAIAGMLLVNADFKFETSTEKHSFRLTRSGKKCSVELSADGKAKDGWVSGSWTDSIEFWETLEELNELSEDVYED